VGASSARLFVLVSGNLRGDQQASILVDALPSIRIRSRRPGPFIDKTIATVA
jgi:hypothetical protein